LIKIDALPFIIIALVLAMLSLIFFAKRWQLLLENQSNEIISVSKLVRYCLIGAFYNLFMPGAIGGDIIRSRNLISKHNIGLKHALKINIIERVIGLIGLVFILSISLSVFTEHRLKIIEFTGKDLYQIFHASLIIFFIALLITFVFYKLSIIYFEAFIITLFIHVVEISMAWWLGYYLNINIGFEGFLWLMPIIYLITAIPISVGGLGVREASLSAGLLFFF
jgi:uncharacterized membrane protein YbhN (UPF0104 family)